MPGVVLSIPYSALCGFQHPRALDQFPPFPRQQGRPVKAVASVPMPPSPVDWNGLVLTPDGVYGSRFNVNTDAGGPRFLFLRDSPLNPDIEKAFQVPAVQVYLGFARFPIVRYRRIGRRNIVDFLDIRFFNYEQREGRHPFVYSVVFGTEGQVLQQGWRMR